MRYLTYVLVPVLLLSIIGNVILYNKTEGKRTAVTINDEKITKGQFNYWLDAHYGGQARADMIRYHLVMQAARAKGCPPDEKEIEQALKDAPLQNPAVAIASAREPWRMDDAKQRMELQSALANLRTADVKVSDDDVRQFFVAHSALYQTPDKYLISAVVVSDPNAVPQALALMKNVNDATVVTTTLHNRAAAVGVDGKWQLVKPAGAAPTQLGTVGGIVNAASSMAVGDVRAVQVGRSLVVFKLLEKTPGKPADFNEVKAKVVRDCKLSRALPPDEVLRKLWDGSNITTDPPGYKDQIENMLFPKQPGVAVQGAGAQ